MMRKVSQGFSRDEKLKKSPFINIAFIYPNLSKAGYSNLGFLRVSENWAKHPAYRTKLFALDELKEDGSWADPFHIIAFSISCENDIINAWKILKNVRERKSLPLVLAGGAGISSNPEPGFNLFDFVVIGEADSVVEELGDEILPFFIGETGREELLMKLSRKGYIYVPEFYEFQFDEFYRIKEIRYREGVPQKVKWRKEDLHRITPAFREPVGKDIEMGDMFLIEISRGCPHRCPFCLIAHTYFPKRDYPADKIIEIVEKNRAKTVGLIAPVPTSHREFKKILEDLVKKGRRVSLSSMSLQNFDPEILKLLSSSGTKSVTIAPETGSDELRKKIGKRFTSNDLISFVQSCEKNGIMRVKMYFMVGLPGEKKDHVMESAQLVLNAQKSVKLIKISASVSPFVPKPHTPFERYPMNREEEIREKFEMWKSIVRGRVKIEFGSVKDAILQGLIGLGGRWVKEFLHCAAEKSVSFALREYREFLEKYLFREKGKDEILPWHIIEV